MDEISYQKDVQYWRHLLEDAMRGSCVNDVKAWLNTSYTNYAPGDDFVLIASLYSPSKSKGLSVQQYLKAPVGAPWLKVFSRVAAAETGRPIKHLVINCARDLEVESLIRAAVKLWFHTETENLFCSTESENGLCTSRK